ncbi:hypothetical protein FE784_07295 [Paenibacillus hemerocallicola]|uniref:Uncharacterized protein n=1 Tax=Paenibacillus hemerocallicola TaxID=1172614 RepID=A0A5C4TD61_9BACL|nr:hypothetical protein [Paenibacillus hemerocallicola]TNJ66998.1 hypothetical protein FE784_07295 [Paenibacillus hemerocallicola]
MNRQNTSSRRKAQLLLSRTSDLAKLGAFLKVVDALTIRGAERENRKGESTGNCLLKGLDYLEMHYAEGITIEKVNSFVEGSFALNEGT